MAHIAHHVQSTYLSFSVPKIEAKYSAMLLLVRSRQPLRASKGAHATHRELGSSARLWVRDWSALSGINVFACVSFHFSQFIAKLMHAHRYIISLSINALRACVYVYIW